MSLFSHSRENSLSKQPGMQNPNGTALQISLVPTMENGTRSAPGLRQHEVAGSPMSTSYDSAGCSRSNIKNQLGERAWQKPRHAEREENVLPVPLGKVYLQCLGNASYSLRQGAGGLNTRKNHRALVIKEIITGSHRIS